jgi:hypothetical protein
MWVLGEGRSQNKGDRSSKMLAVGRWSVEPVEQIVLFFYLYHTQHCRRRGTAWVLAADGTFRKARLRARLQLLRLWSKRPRLSLVHFIHNGNIFDP